MKGSGHGRRYERAFMRSLLDQAATRGWSLVRLARECGISLPTLIRWRGKLAGETAPSFVELVRTTAGSSPPPPPPIASAPIEVVFPGDIRVLVRDTGISDELLVRVLRATARSAC